MKLSRTNVICGDLGILVLLALGRMGLHTVTNSQYGFHRDELAMLDDARYLAWGYVAYPPVTPLIGPVGKEFHSKPRHFEAYVRLLETHAPVQELWMGPADQFTEYFEPSRHLLAIMEVNAEILREGFEELIAELPDWSPFLAIVEENQAVSVCRSVRITHDAHEAGVETLQDFRGKGYAKEVVAGWARLVQSMGALPLYSTSWENTASQAVAKKLRLVPYGADFHVT